jgi:hypothetical protein
MVKTKRSKQRTVQKELSSAFFERTKPKFLDWIPSTPDELLLQAQKRKEERDAQLRKVTEIDRAKQAEKKSKKKIPPGP